MANWIFNGPRRITRISVKSSCLSFPFRVNGVLRYELAKTTREGLTEIVFEVNPVRSQVICKWRHWGTVLVRLSESICLIEPLEILRQISVLFDCIWSFGPAETAKHFPLKKRYYHGTNNGLSLHRSQLKSTDEIIAVGKQTSRPAFYFQKREPA